MTSFLKLSLLAVPLIMLALSAYPVLAQIEPVTGACGFPGAPACVGGETIAGNVIPFLKPFIDAALFLIGTLAVIFLVYAGVKYIMSRGEEEEAKRAKMQIAYAVIGIVVALGARTIYNALETTGTDEDGAEAGAGGIINLVTPFISLALFLVGTAAAIFLVYAGFKYISSRGEEEEAKQAKMQIAYAIIGLTVVGLSAAITRLIVAPLGGIPSMGFIGTYPGTVEGGIRAVVNVLLSLVGITAVIFVVYAGVKYIMSEGDEEEASQAKRQIIYALIGLTVVLLSSVIVNLVIGAI